MNSETHAKTCMWCGSIYNGVYIFCDECMEDEASFQDRWNIASQLEGELEAPADFGFCHSCGAMLKNPPEDFGSLCLNCMWWI